MKKIFAIAFIVTLAMALEMAVTKEYTEHLKKVVSWEVAEYEDNIFRGWTMSEARMLLGAVPTELETYVEEVEPLEHLPSTLDWTGQKCDHEVRNQGSCGSCWAFATAAMLSARCCLQGRDSGWLAPQELVSCDQKNKGCDGGWCTAALDYVRAAKGLVHEGCFPYRAQKLPCPGKCADGKDWSKSHVCNCVSGYKICNGIQAVKTCLASGPITVAFGVCKSFFAYKSGVYKCDCNNKYEGLHAVLAMGYSDTPVCNYRVKNSWGGAWGVKGYFNIACDQCGISGTFAQGNVACDKVA